MDEATAVLRQLERIEALEAAGASPAQVLEELRELVAEAEAWARREGGDRATNAVERLRTALARDMIVV